MEIALTTFPSSIVYVSKSFPGGSGVSSSVAVTVKIVLPVLMSCNQEKVLVVSLSVYMSVCLSSIPLSVCICLCFSLSVFLSVCLYVCMSVKEGGYIY